MITNRFEKRRVTFSSDARIFIFLAVHTNSRQYIILHFFTLLFLLFRHNEAFNVDRFYIRFSAQTNGNHKSRLEIVYVILYIVFVYITRTLTIAHFSPFYSWGTTRRERLACPEISNVRGNAMIELKMDNLLKECIE